ncbi:MAG: hypothetical protein GY861_24635 [bacterium]|nr:hypothetical protein [bacterium]
MTSYDIALRENQYRSVAKRIARYYQESAKGADIPVVLTDSPDMLEYRYSNFVNAGLNASGAGTDFREAGIKASLVSNYTDIALFAHQLNLTFTDREINSLGSKTIADKRDALLHKFAMEVDDATFHGPKNDNGMQLLEGLIGQLTSMENLNGTNSTLTTKGYIWKAIIKMINGIPFAMREEGPSMLLYVTPNLYEKLVSPDRVYMDMQELDFIKKNLMSAETPKGFKIAKIVVTNKIAAEATDNTDGDNADTVDTEGTHDRMFLICPDPRWVGRVVSRGFSLIGEESTILGLRQIWGVRTRAYFFNTDCAEYSEAIQW